MARNYDLLPKGAHVIDPKNGIDAVRDLAIAGGKIAAIAPQMNADDAGKIVFDIKGAGVPWRKGKLKYPEK